MKEQVITPRATVRSSLAGKRVAGAAAAAMQRPVRRDRGAGVHARVRESRWRAFAAYLPLAGKITLAVVIGMLLFMGYRAAASASFFQARDIEVSGAARTSADEVKMIVRRATRPAGVWRADLSMISTELERLHWVRRVAVTRVLPDGIRVRLVEREPRAVLRTSNGRLMWVDEEGFMLGAVQPTDQMPDFFLRGLDEAETIDAREGNRVRMRRGLEMAAQWSEANLAGHVSEVNLDDLRDVRVQLAGDDAQIEVRLGGEEYTKRLKQALEVIDEQRDTARGPFITYVDMRKGKQAVVGTDLNARISAEGVGGDSINGNAAQDDPLRAQQAKAKAAGRGKDEKDKAAARKQDEPRKKEQGKREAAIDEAKSKSRPRRVA